MNKELILKYRNEFNHWIDGGKLLARVITSDEDDFTYTVWHEVDDIVLNFDKWKATYLFGLSEKEADYYKPQFVINDEYSIYRKALAEGKTIQIAGLNPIAHPHAHKNTWEDMQGTVFNKAIELYRIKPEEPKFKVGDWVRDLISGKIHRVNNEDTVNSKFSQVIKWQPKEGEWCWFWNFNEMPTLEQFSKYHNLDDHLGNYETLAVKLYQHCEPFIGELPSFLQH